MVRLRRQIVSLVVVALLLQATGCHHFGQSHAITPVASPRELEKMILPDYVIEPPDMLSIEAITVIPKSPYRLRTQDIVQIDVRGALPDIPISGLFPIQLGGVVDLGVSYGTVKVTGMTIEEAREAVDKHLREILNDPKVTLTLGDIAGKQQIAGEHLVGPDGKVTLGSYGKVSVVGLTVEEAKLAIEQHLSEFLEEPEVSVDVFGFNSKVYYVITEGAIFGDAVYRIPATGNETVLDAIAQINGLSTDSSWNIWVARPSTNPERCHDVLPVDWCAVTKYGDIATNYQVLPGDRVYVASDKFMKADTKLARFFSPFERIFGFSLLGVTTVTRFSGNVLAGGGNPFNSGGTGGR